MRLEVADILSSKAKFKVLEVLTTQEHPLHLRTVADLCQIPIRSVVFALNALQNDKVVRVHVIRKQRLYAFNPRHELASTLQSVFAVLAKEKLRQRSQGFTDQAKRALALTLSAKALFREI